MIDGHRTSALILAVFQEDGLRLRMGAEEADEFLSTVAHEADHACLIFIHCSE
jgi:hypothetical protein